MKSEEFPPEIVPSGFCELTWRDRRHWHMQEVSNELCLTLARNFSSYVDELTLATRDKGARFIVWRWKKSAKPTKP